MRHWWRVPLAIGLAACSLSGQRKEYVELQLEVAMFADQLKALQRSMDEKLAQLTQQLQQAMEASSRTNASVAELGSKVEGQTKSLNLPVATIGSKVDQMASDFQTLREAVGSLNARLARFEQQLLDISTAIKTLQSPPMAPPSTPSISAEALFQNATRDRESGNFELALREFTDYVQVYGSTGQAAAAQYYIGDILYRLQRYEEAVNAFDLVLTNYLDSDRAPDAHYMKAMALTELGETAKARTEFNLLIKRFKNHELAKRAQAQLKALPAASKPARPQSK